jgi:DNA-binding transcriptional ArsR family regulator
MVQYPPGLDRTFSALGDNHRRTILDRLGGGPASISDLAEPLGMTLPGVLKHVHVLEEAHLIETHKDGRTRWCQLAPRPLDEVTNWVEERRQRWGQLIDRFEEHVAHTPRTSL